MHPAIHNENRGGWDQPSSTSASYGGGGGGEERNGMIERMAAENPVLVVGRGGCCMIHVVRQLLQGLGVNPSVCEVGEDAEEMVAEQIMPRQQHDRTVVVLPAVFIGGRLLGGIERLMAVHISGELVPILKEAGALWL